MSRLDLVIFGATGFTGKSAVAESVRLAKKYNFTWGVAGRSQKKLDELMTEVSNKTGEDLSSVRKIIADVSDEASLKAMCEQAKVVANCCGPYRLFGEPVVKAAIVGKAHYVDVSGEPQFIETMQLKYSQEATEAGVYIISACGFDSIPNDMGVVFLQQQFQGTLNSVESYLSTHLPSQYRAEAARSGVIHYGTWDSLVRSIAHMNELGPLRKQIYPQRLPTFKPKLETRSVIHKREGRWCLPFPGSDNSIVYRTQRRLYEAEQRRPVHFRAYTRAGSLLSAAVMVLAGLFLFVMTKTACTRKLLLKYPRVFSFGMVTKEGPKEEVSNNTSFKFELYGEGWARGADIETTKPNMMAVARVTGVNPGYGATVTALLGSAITILKQQDKLPGTGGVLTTGAAFYHTDLIKLLNENNLKFEIVKILDKPQ